MIQIRIATILATISLATINCYPYLHHPFEYPPYRYGGYVNYPNQLQYNYFPSHNALFEDKDLLNYLSQPEVLPVLNVLAEKPYEIGNKFTTVPMLVVSKENMKMVSNAHIMEVSKTKPKVTIETENKKTLECTPAVKVILERPVVVYSLKSSIVFPTEILISHGGYRIPISIGAVLAPIAHDVFVSAETPVAVDVVYAIPTKPVSVQYLSGNDVSIAPASQAVIVESTSVQGGNAIIPESPTKNITVLHFPTSVASPTHKVDAEDEELVNRNPPQFLVPAGIVQSTQPLAFVEPFHNSKESAVLTELREDAKKRV